MHRLQLWRACVERLAAGERVFLSVVVDHTRHSPGTRGACLMRFEDGQSLGTIGGGAMEQRALRHGAEAFEATSGAGRLEPMVHRREVAPEETATKSGMICAGRQTNASILLDPVRDLAAARAVLDHLEGDRAGEWVLGPAGLSVEPGVPKEEGPCVWVVRDGEDFEVRGQLRNLFRVAIFGGGHCGLALSQQLALLDAVVTVVDVRPDLRPFRENTCARYRHVVEDYAEAAGCVTEPERTSAIVMTSDAVSDTRALLGVLGRPFPFVGVMGARAKLRAIEDALEALGVSEADRGRIVAPVGLDIGSGTPAEIAVSVAAQLIRAR